MADAWGTASLAYSARFDQAQAWLSASGDAILREQVEIARVPAPPFGERRRAEVIAAKLSEIGLAPEFDEVGNLLAWLPARTSDLGPSAGPVVVAAHVDTVFGPDVAVTIRREGPRWVGPGITDNARGLAVTLAVARALARTDSPRPAHPIVFAFTVGEEGSGDLRGVKHLFAAGGRLREAHAFVGVDGSGLGRIIHRALGCRRFRITVRGPGGHSWSDWGRANPAVAVGELIHRLARLPLPHEPRTTLTIARLGGGTSINAIPAESWLEVDVRSEGAAALDAAEAAIRDSVPASAAAEAERGEGPVSAEVQLIGERPAGALPISHPLVTAAAEATRALGVEPEYAVSSTDANVPMALGVPAIALGGGGESGDTHTESEWFEDTDGAAGALRLLTTLAAIAGV
jgi:acetylornithine deacetylase/succinyl-diaminopimelate desuccinylase-like protein